MKRLVRRLKALSDGTRLSLLVLLSERPCCVCELAAALNLSQPTVTRHLQKLSDAGFVSAERHGFFQIYRLAPEDEEAQRLLTLTFEALKDDPAAEALRERLRRLEVGPPFLRKETFGPCTGPEEKTLRRRKDEGSKAPL